MSDPHEPSDEIKAYALACRDLLGLGAWDITIKMVDTPTVAHGQPYGDSPAGCTFSEPYRIASIELTRGRTSEEYQVSVMHEMLHLALAPMDRAGEIVAAFLKPRYEQAAQLLLSEACERVVTPLAKSLVHGIRPTGRIE